MIVEVRRGDIVESRHEVSAAAVDAQGRLLDSTGDVERLTFMRSSFKPIQATACLATGVAGKLGLSTREIAVSCASHVGTDEHVEVVAGLLAKAGASPADLTCGVHPPVDEAARRALYASGGEPQVLHSNCSGKHALMVATCRANGWPVEGYQERDHPLQRAIFDLVGRLVGEAGDDLPWGIDGCGLPAVALSVRQMALAFARLGAAAGMSAAGAAADGEAAAGASAKSGLTPAECDAAAQVTSAMRAFPHLTRGQGRFAVDLMQKTALWAKPGADAVFCCGSVEGEWGFALKVEDGGSRAVAPGTVAALRRFALLTPEACASLAAWERVAVRNVAGRVIGEIAAASGTP